MEPDHPELSVRVQCELLGLARSSCFYRPQKASAAVEAQMRAIDELYVRYPFYGSRRIAEELGANRKQIQRLMRTMGIAAIYPKKRTTIAGRGHKIYPYLLRNVKIERVDQVWSTDITYIPLGAGWVYLVAVIDWFSRKVLCWQLSNMLEGSFCVSVLEEALASGTPEVFNTDQGCQFTSKTFTSRLEAAGVAISMDGRGRALDNVFIERLWRSVKYENVYLRDYQSVRECEQGLAAYFEFYNTERRHQALGNRTPAEVYCEGSSSEGEAKAEIAKSRSTEVGDRKKC